MKLTDVTTAFTVFTFCACVAQAQPQFGFKAGTYELATEAAVRHPAMLRFQGFGNMVAKLPDGSKTTFTPRQVSAFQIGKDKYVAVSNFTIHKGGFEVKVDKAFVEVVDSGEVVLARYLLQSGSDFLDVYLLRPSAIREFTVVPYNLLGDGGKEFREALQPYVSSRTDLAILVDSKRITNGDLPALIRALNSGEPYNPSVSSGR